MKSLIGEQLKSDLIKIHNIVKRNCVAHLAGLWYSHKKSNRGSGTGTRFSLGSMVQKGKFSAGAADFVSTLKNVDLPTFWKNRICLGAVKSYLWSCRTYRDANDSDLQVGADTADDRLHFRLTFLWSHCYNEKNVKLIYYDPVERSSMALGSKNRISIYNQK